MRFVLKLPVIKDHKSLSKYLPSNNSKYPSKYNLQMDLINEVEFLLPIWVRESPSKLHINYY